ncbi:MAG: sigma-70 family RNA polymerase sigma factor, partial [Muribaculaceae bacterium]|nr:sigma-70 family RNA polymerase sigma factor [Muribaculaceae bacterium]
MKHLELNIDNQTLVEECRSGDRDAMSILYTRFAPRMLHVITRYVSDRDSAHDILHDGFIAAFTRIDSLRDPEHIEFWLATIMKNLSLKYLQAQTVTSILEEIPEIVEEPEIDDILDFATLETLIRQLPEGYQKVFRLAVLEGKSHKEISEILGIAPNSSSSQLFHAKLRLRELIKDYQLRAGLISLLLLIACSGLFFIARKADGLQSRDSLSADARPEKKISKPERPTEPSIEVLPEETSEPSVAIRSKNTGVIPPVPASEDIADSNAEENESPIASTTDESQSTIESDSIGESTSSKKLEKLPVKPLEDDYGNAYDRLFADVPSNNYKDKGWSAGISFDPGITSFNGVNQVSDSANSPSY